MITSQMSPMGAMVVIDSTQQIMSPAGASLSMFVAATIFPAQYIVPTAVALFGITP